MSLKFKWKTFVTSEPRVTHSTAHKYTVRENRGSRGIMYVPRIQPLRHRYRTRSRGLSKPASDGTIVTTSIIQSGDPEFPEITFAQIATGLVKREKRSSRVIGMHPRCTRTSASRRISSVQTRVQIENIHGELSRTRNVDRESGTRSPSLHVRCTGKLVTLSE